jgi:flagellum-specific peptidoglycan hydrolase FlgJ
MTAQSALETGHWESIHWYNFGNVKRKVGKPWTMFRCNEVIDGKTVWFNPPHPQTHFRAYADANDGAEEYVRFLAIDTTPDNGRPNRYARAWYAAENDDPIAFSQELSKAGYYTAAESRYTKTLVSCFNRYF